MPYPDVNLGKIDPKKKKPAVAPPGPAAVAGKIGGMASNAASRAGAGMAAGPSGNPSLGMPRTTMGQVVPAVEAGAGRFAGGLNDPKQSPSGPGPLAMPKTTMGQVVDAVDPYIQGAIGGLTGPLAALGQDLAAQFKPTPLKPAPPAPSLPPGPPPQAPGTYRAPSGMPMVGPQPAVGTIGRHPMPPVQGPQPGSYNPQGPVDDAIRSGLLGDRIGAKPQARPDEVREPLSPTLFELQRGGNPITKPTGASQASQFYANAGRPATNEEAADIFRLSPKDSPYMPRTTVGGAWGQSHDPDQKLVGRQLMDQMKGNQYAPQPGIPSVTPFKPNYDDGGASAASMWDNRMQNENPNKLFGNTLPAIGPDGRPTFYARPTVQDNSRIGASSVSAALNKVGGGKSGSNVEGSAQAKATDEARKVFDARRGGVAARRADYDERTTTAKRDREANRVQRGIVRGKRLEDSLDFRRGRLSMEERMAFQNPGAAMQGRLAEAQLKSADQYRLAQLGLQGRGLDQRQDLAGKQIEANLLGQKIRANGQAAAQGQPLPYPDAEAGGAQSQSGSPVDTPSVEDLVKLTPSETAEVLKKYPPATRRRLQAEVEHAARVNGLPSTGGGLLGLGAYGGGDSLTEKAIKNNLLSKPPDFAYPKPPSKEDLQDRQSDKKWQRRYRSDLRRKYN